MTKKIKIKDHIWEWGKRTYIMGILNITPDSFSDGGRFIHHDAAIQHALQMCEAGVDIIDIGGESTRPGASPVTVDEEIQRVVPLIQLLNDKISVPISVDTYRARTAQMTLDAGAAMINDVWGLKADPEMAPLVG